MFLVMFALALVMFIILILNTIVLHASTYQSVVLLRLLISPPLSSCAGVAATARELAKDS